MIILRTTFIAAVFFLAAMFQGTAAFAENISGVEISRLTTLSPDLVREIAEIQVGDPYSVTSVNHAISNFKNWGVFEKADISTFSTPEGIVIHFELKEAPIIVSIDIAGNYPYIENKIRKYLNLHPGDVYVPDKIPEQIERIKTFYEREGFVGTEIYVEEDIQPVIGGVILTFHIKHGSSMRYRTIDVSGNRVFPKGRFVSIINTYKPFSEKRLSDAIRKIKETYQAHGYPRTRVKVKSKNLDFDKHRVDLALEVLEGPHIKVIFKGAKHLNRRQMLRTITIMNEGSTDQYEIENSVNALKDFFKDGGYPNATADGVKSELPDGTIVVTFHVNEGREQRIAHIGFYGNRNVDSSDLTREMKNKTRSLGSRGAFYPEDEKDDNKNILKAFRKHGYLNSKIAAWKTEPTPQGYALNIKIPVEEGEQTLVGSIIFNGNKGYNAAKLLHEIKIKPGKAFDEPDLETDRQRLLTFYADNGYPYVDIKQGWKIDEETKKAEIQYDINEGSAVHIGKILIIGNVLTSQKAIKNAMDFKEGELFSYRKIIDSQLNIRRLGPFAAVNIETIGIEEKEAKVHIKVKVEEQRPFQVDLAVGYSTDEQFTGSLMFTNLNAFGWAKSNTLKLTGGKKLSRAEIGWIDPRFFSSSFEMSTVAWIQYKQRPAYTFIQEGGALGWFRRLRRFGLFFRYEVDRNRFLEGDSVAADADSLRNNTISRIALAANFDSRDSFSDPRKGFFTQGGVDIFNEIKGNQANFFKFSWQGENDLTAFDKITLSTALRFNRIQTIGSNVSVPTNELLFLGGDDTLRGFPEDSLGPLDAAGKATGARLRWIVNEELRFRVWRSLMWAFFYDMGSLTDTFGAINSGTIRKSFGFGLRYLTPVGPIRAEYGFKLGRTSNESIGRFHFTFGYVF